MNEWIIGVLNTILQSWLMAMFLGYHLESKRTKNTTIMWVMASVLFVEAVVLITRMGAAENMFMYTVVLFVVGRMLYLNEWRIVGIVMLKMMALDLIAELATGITFYFVVDGDWSGFVDSGATLTVGEAFFNLYFLCAILIYFVATRIEEGSTKWQLFTAIIAVIGYQIMALLMIFYGYVNSEDDMLRYGILIFVVVAAQIYCVLAILTIIVPLVAKQKMAELDALQQKMQLEQYQMTEAAILQMRKLKHDFANHMQTIQVLEKQKEYDLVGKYLEQMQMEYQEVKEVQYCENKIINTVLMVKTELAKENEIPVELSIGQVPKLALSERHLSAVLSNLYDNAIEACCYLKVADKGIQIKIGMQKNHLVIVMSNRYAGKIDSQFTSKKSNKEHGYGLQIIKDSVAHLKGHINISTKKGVFEVTVTIKAEKNTNSYKKTVDSYDHIKIQ